MLEGEENDCVQFIQRVVLLCGEWRHVIEHKVACQCQSSVTPIVGIDMSQWGYECFEADILKL